MHLNKLKLNMLNVRKQVVKIVAVSVLLSSKNKPVTIDTKGRMRTPVRDPFSYGIRHGIRHIHCDSMKYDLMLHWITMNRPMPYPVPHPVWKCLPYGSTHPPYSVSKWLETNVLKHCLIWLTSLLYTYSSGYRLYLKLHIQTYNLTIPHINLYHPPYTEVGRSDLMLLNPDFPFKLYFDKYICFQSKSQKKIHSGTKNPDFSIKRSRFPRGE